MGRNHKGQLGTEIIQPDKPDQNNGSKCFKRAGGSDFSFVLMQDGSLLSAGTMKISVLAYRIRQIT